MPQRRILVGVWIGTLLVATPAMVQSSISRLSLTSGVAQTESRNCGTCHNAEFSLWAHHVHSHFLVDPDTDPRLIDARWGKRVEGWQEHVAGKFQPDEVALAYGQLQLQVYFQRKDDGHHILPAQWNRRERRWEPLPTELERFRRSQQTWEAQCAGCHTTGYVPGDGTYVEANASCRACHGDASAHLASAGKQPLVTPSSLSARDLSDICGACHSRGVDIATQLPYPVGFTPGSSLASTYRLHAPNPGVDTEHFWADGTERLAFMEYQGFIRSNHYQQGMTCTSCHLPHGSEQPRGLRRKTDELCTGCHQQPGRQGASHQRHPQGAADCVDCHMARINTEPDQLQTHSHSFRVMEPPPHSASAMPSACTVDCHQDRSPAWAVEVRARWNQNP